MSKIAIYVSILLISFAGCAKSAHAEIENTTPKTPHSVNYAIESDGDLIGYATIVFAGIKEWDGKSVEVIESKTVLKVKILGKPRVIGYKSETYLEPIGRPTSVGKMVFYKVKLVSGKSIQLVECEYQDGEVHLFAFGEGEERGTAKVIKLEPNTFTLDANNFAHWYLMTRNLGKVAGKHKVSAFIPALQTTQSMTLTPIDSEEIEASGEKRICDKIGIDGQSTILYVDAKTHELVRFEIPSQKSVVRITDETVDELKQRHQTKEILESHFCQSNVVFDSFLDVTYMEAEIDLTVIGAGIETKQPALTTKMQKFMGEKNKENISGTIEIRSLKYDGKNAPSYPYEGDDKEKWLKPSVYIESDDEKIMQQAKELTEGAQNSWETTVKIADWVKRNIKYVIADTPSAKLALERRVGDCGPHSTLTIAMLRSIGIPAKLVGGLMYSPTFGGSFGQHGWVEVYMGADGWVPIDPTTGEYESINAAHIKLFEGLGGVLPESVKVLQYEPPNKPTSPTATAEVRPIPFELNKEYTVKYTQNGQSIGDEKFTIAKVEHEGKEAYKLRSIVDLQIGNITVKGTTTMVVKPNMRPLSFKTDMKAAGTEYSLDCTFSDNDVTERVVRGDMDFTKTIKLSEGRSKGNVLRPYCFDNNLLGSWALLCTQLPYKIGEKINFTTYHPSSMQQIPITFNVKRMTAVKYGGTDVESFECYAEQIKNTFWVTKDGKFIKAQQGGLVMELE